MSFSNHRFAFYDKKLRSGQPNPVSLPESKESTGLRSKFNNILVVVCALTRFTLFIPVTYVTAEETWRVLVNRVFAVFGHPTVIVSDNGSTCSVHGGMEQSTSHGSSE